MKITLVLPKIADSLLVSEKIGDLIKMETSVGAALESLQSELETLVCFLKGVAEKQETDQRVVDLVVEIEKTLSEADVILDALFLDVVYSKSIFNRFCSLRNKKVKKLAKLRYQIRAFSKNLKISGVNLSPYNDLQFLKRSRCVEDSFVGLKDDAEKVVAILVDKVQDRTCSLICISGAGGLGKTTLAKRVFYSPQVRSHFEGFAWVKVARNSRTRQVFEDILLQLVSGFDEEEMRALSTFGLLGKLIEVLKINKKCLVVLDDVLVDDWECLRIAFLSKNTTSKVVFTTRCREVADGIAVKEKGITHRVRTLTKDESWELFLETAFPGKFAVDNHLNEEMHVNLLDKCSGLPLAIVLLGKLWGRNHTRKEWQVVTSMQVQSSDEFSKMLLRVLVLNNYNDLPYYLKPCFLYLGLFPEGSEIDSEILFHLWIAEGLIAPPTDKHLESKMDIAQCYLDELIIRSMVQVQQVKSRTGTTSLFKTVLLHDLMRDLCLSKGIEESFSKVMDLQQSSNQLHILTDHPATPRLSLYTDMFEDRHHVDLQDVNNTHPLCSLLLLNFNRYQKDITMPSIVSSLKHLRSSLRILHFDGFNFGTGESLKVIGKLTRLTYLSLSECFLDELPSYVVKLINLQTLDLRVQNSITIPNILWNIKRLRHLYLPCQFCVFRDEELQLGGLNFLETLENFNTALCNVDDLFTLPNLCHLEVTTAEGNLDNLQAIMNKFSTKSRCPLHFRRSFNRYSKKRGSFVKKAAVQGVSTIQFMYRGEKKPFYHR